MNGKKRIAILIAVAVAFMAFDLSIYFSMTYRMKTNFSSGNGGMIEVTDYLPFDESGKIAKLSGASLSFAGEDTNALPVLDGATALLPVYSAIFNAVYPESAMEFDGENFTDQSKIHYTNTVGAYKAIVDGDADVIFCAKPSTAQIQYATDNGVELKLTPVGVEAFVFITNAKNPVDSLTVDEVRGMYSGKIKNWKDVGGKFMPVNALTRAKNSGSQTTMEKFMGDTEIVPTPFAFLGGSIGFSFRFYTTGIVDNQRVKLLALNGVAPTAENIRNKSYPVTTELMMVTRAGDTNPNVQKLIDWVLSDEGQKLIEDSGYVGIV